MNEQQVKVLNALLFTLLDITDHENVYGKKGVVCAMNELPDIFKGFISKENLKLIENTKD
ncbi:MAG: hypothetical protein BWK73_10460 [Thiothrix lacustris]|uniref:Uncharacterized protein n=1 Tax=Thiothrix lacustris TaxID=525917 RepID=A0A1Y1QUX3_9GAMM|nr:MAG: hypothetical protein BWK73_10460 [Thiothrix lacustris]